MNSSPRSVCPICLRPIPARHETVAHETFLVKECPEHGAFRTVVWRGEPSFDSWARPKVPSGPKTPFTRVERGCPLDCGLCDAHRQHTCTALIEVTWRCDLGCPVCFASSGKAAPPDPSLDALDTLFDRVELASGHCNIQLSGGEPTVREDLPEIIRLGKARGFPFIQLNTNGLRLGCEPGYADRLAEAGLDSVFLQFDGTEESIFEALRGRPLLETKLAALDALARAGVGVILVPTLVPGVNDRDLGNILRLGAARSPAVRGVHFQPVSYFGRYPKQPDDGERMTLPEIMRGLEAQTGGMLRATDFRPPGCEHAYCSFHANYVVTEDGGLTRLSSGGSCGCTPRPASEGADAAKAFVKRQWAAPGKQLPMAFDGPGGAAPSRSAPEDALDAFIRRAATHTFAVSAMAFQDCWTLDLERLKGCCIHEVSPDGRLIPFCAYNLTSMGGETLYRGKCHGPVPS
ncbi:Radical SAM domain protein [Pseudodesulfovibrio mercurii]|uniref:Radical SAM domain protein n=1 Tax=Pseudodesulfovibrio mercurii TaxID=641491 RepID=F0JDJ5_9BACT|nr:radical SAM (seleno)protein TrsS [Pseudodesulfovibrio mercurii]EGB13364.1 Radical SAM domain protein [Pseudodesulfovibrio mercurii]